MAVATHLCAICSVEKRVFVNNLNYNYKAITHGSKIVVVQKLHSYLMKTFTLKEGEKRIE